MLTKALISTQAGRPHLGGEVRRTVLPNGLRVVTEEMVGSHTFSLGVFVDVGSRHEAPQLHGAAHFLEHVLFKGTATRDAKEISAAFDRIGGEANAFTAKEYTCFHAKVMAEDAEQALDVILDMLTHSTIRPADFEAERDVILDEIAMHHDEPDEIAWEMVSRHLFGDHPLAREVIGSGASISALSREQVYSFWKRHYRPCDMVVSAAGNVDHDGLVARLAQLQGEVRPHRRQKAPMLPTQAAVRTHTRPLEQTTCVLGFRGIEQFDDRRFAGDILTMVLGGGMSSRLFYEVREARGLAYQIDASTVHYSDAGVFALEWTSIPERTREICKVVRRVCDDVVDNGVTGEELQRAKGQLRGQTLIQFEQPEVRMGRIGRAELRGDSRDMNQILDAYEAVTVADVQDVAAQLLRQPPVLASAGAKVDRSGLDRFVKAWPTA